MDPRFWKVDKSPTTIAEAVKCFAGHFELFNTCLHVLEARGYWATGIKGWVDQTVIAPNMLMQQSLTGSMPEYCIIDYWGLYFVDFSEKSVVSKD